MTAANQTVLTPAFQKLARRQPFTVCEVEAFQALPYRLSRLEAGKFIVREGDRPEVCAALLSGYAYRQKSTRAGARQILSIHLQGDLVDLQNSLLERADHSVQALTTIEVANIPKTAIADLTNQYPNIARAFLLDTLVDASLTREWMLNIGRRNARARVAHLFCELALRQEAAGISDGPQYELPLTQEQVGDITGLTAVHVNRTVQALRADGLLETNGRTMKITDWRGLQSVGGFNRAYLHEPECGSAQRP